MLHCSLGLKVYMGARVDVDGVLALIKVGVSEIFEVEVKTLFDRGPFYLFVYVAL